MKKTIHYPGRAGFAPERAVAVGGVLPAPEPIGYNEGRPVVRLAVRNTGDRPVQVGSHFHFFEVNRFLAFDRPAAFGCHLNIPATTAVRFEPGDERQVELVPYAGKRRVIGFNGLVMGYAGSPSADTPYLPTREQALRRMRQRGFICLEAGPQEAGGARSQQAAEPAKGPAKRPAAGRSLRTAGVERLPVPPRPRGRRKRSEGAATGSETK